MRMIVSIVFTNFASSVIVLCYDWSSLLFSNVPLFDPLRPPTHFLDASYVLVSYTVPPRPSLLDISISGSMPTIGTSAKIAERLDGVHH